MRSEKARRALAIVLAVAVAALLLTVAIASGDEEADSTSAQPQASGEAATLAEDWVSTPALVKRGEALPCTGLKAPINFEVLSAGSQVAGLPMTDTIRRCDTASPADESPANRITYVYGDCELPEGEGGCAPPLQIQTWPACQRSKAGYSFEGKPLPFRRLPSHGGAEVVEFNFALESRIEVYTKSSTVVIFADNRELALEAIESLAPQEVGEVPVTNPANLRGAPPAGLAAPSDGAVEGDLPCNA